MTLKSWSTADVGAPDRFHYWHDAISAAVLNVRPSVASAEDFAGRISCAELGGIRVARFTSSAHEIVRTRAHTSQADSEHYLLSLQRRGSSRMWQDEGCCELRPGEAGIIDGTRPFRIDFPADVERMVVVLPHALLRRRAPWLKRGGPVKLQARQPFFQLCGVYVETFSHLTAISRAEESVLGDNFCNIVSLLSAPSGADSSPERSVAAIDLGVILAYLKANLFGPDLSPQGVARHLRISPRTLHKRFEEAGLTFGRWLLAERLEACRRMLVAADHRRRTISEIAFSAGFNDLSHFSKSFRSAYGVSPRTFRQHGMSRQTAANGV